MFQEHATKLTDVAKLACNMSNNGDGVKMVLHATSQIENLCPQVGVGNKNRQSETQFVTSLMTPIIRRYQNLLTFWDPFFGGFRRDD